MKAIFVFCVMMAVGGINANMAELSQKQKDKAQQLTLECIKQSGVKTETLAEVKKGQFSDDNALKKFTLCFFEKAGILTPDAKLNIDVALAKLPPGVDKAEAAKLLEVCKTKKGKDAADTAYEIFKCYHGGTKTHILF